MTCLVVGAVYIIECCSCPVPTTWKCWRNQCKRPALQLLFPSSLWPLSAQINGILPIFWNLEPSSCILTWLLSRSYLSELFFLSMYTWWYYRSSADEYDLAVYFFLYFERAEYWCFELLWNRNVNSKKEKVELCINRRVRTHRLWHQSRISTSRKIRV